MRFLYSQPDCDFNRLLRAAMTCENESVSRATIRAKVMQFSQGVIESNSTSSEIDSICSQLEQMSTILKGANFSGVRGNNKKKSNGYYKSKADGRQGLRGPETSAAGPFHKDKPPVQCHQCMGWGHYVRNCPNEYPVEGSVNLENSQGEVAKEGGTLPQQANATQNQAQAQAPMQPQAQPGQSP